MIKIFVNSKACLFVLVNKLHIATYVNKDIHIHACNITDYNIVPTCIIPNSMITADETNIDKQLQYLVMHNVM